MKRLELKRAVEARLDNDPDVQTHRIGHQDRYANRYELRSAGGKHVELMFQKDERSPANLWVKKAFAEELLDGPSAGMSLEYKISPAANLYQTVGKNGEKQYGRHTGLKSMPQLSEADLVCFALYDMDNLERILETLKRA